MEYGLPQLLVGPGLGLLLLVHGIRVRIGASKTWFSLKPVAVYKPKNLSYSLIPGGLGYLVLFSSPLWMPTWLPVESRRLIDFAITLPTSILVIIAIWCPPRWMKPAWILWLEDNGYNVDLLRKDVYETYTRKGQAKVWLRMVRTREGVEQWAKEAYARKGLTPRPKPRKSTRN